jgi:hypothetical protein
VGDSRLPSAWRLFYQDGDGRWQPVGGATEFAIRKSALVKVTFEPVTTRAMKLEIDLQPDLSAGLYEWEVAWRAGPARAVLPPHSRKRRRVASVSPGPP